MQVVELIIIAVLAGVVLYQLYAVLGRRVGRQPEEAQAAATARASSSQAALPAVIEDDGVSLSGLAAIRARDPSFEVGRFLQGARQAYQTIVQSFAAGDREALKRLVSDDVYRGFDSALVAREKEGRSEQVEFLNTPRADLESTDVKGDLAKTVVRFLAEFRSRSKGPEGEAVDDRRTAELWTFERNLKNRDPNWVLVHVDVAQA